MKNLQDVKNSIEIPEIENPKLTQLSDEFRIVAQAYKEGLIDYRYIWAWFQNINIKNLK